MVRDTCTTGGVLGFSTCAVKTRYHTGDTTKKREIHDQIARRAHRTVDRDGIQRPRGKGDVETSQEVQSVCNMGICRHDEQVKRRQIAQGILQDGGNMSWFRG